MDTRIKNILFIDQKKYIPALINYNKINKQDNLVIGFNSLVLWELEKHKIPYKTPFDYFSLEEFIRLREELYPLALSICSYISTKIKKYFSDYNNINSYIGESLLHPLKCFLNTFYQRAISFNKVIACEKPNKVVYFYQEYTTNDVELYNNNFYVNIFNKQLKVILSKKGIKYTNLRSKKIKVVRNIISHKFKRILSQLTASIRKKITHVKKKKYIEQAV